MSTSQKPRRAAGAGGGLRRRGQRPLVSGTPPWRELSALAAQIRRDRLSSVILDVTAEARQGVELRRLAARLGAACVNVRDLKARHILRAVQDAEAGA